MVVNDIIKASDEFNRGNSDVSISDIASHHRMHPMDVQSIVSQLMDSGLISFNYGTGGLSNHNEPLNLSFHEDRLDSLGEDMKRQGRRKTRGGGFASSRISSVVGFIIIAVVIIFLISQFA